MTTGRSCAAGTIRAVGLTFAAKRRPWFWRLRTLIVVAVVVAVAVGAFVVIRTQDSGRPALPTAQVDTFLRAWSAGDARKMAAQLDHTPAGLRDLARSLIDSARGSHARYKRTSLVHDLRGAGATATAHAHLDRAAFGP